MRLLIAVTIALACVPDVSAQTFPAKPIQIVNPYQAGGTTDVLTRALVGEMAKELGQPFVVLNRDGAAGGIGTALVAKAAPDGYTLGFVPALTLTVLPHMRKDSGYSSRDLAPVCHAFENVMALAVKPDSPFKTAADFVAKAKAEPGKVKYGHQGIGSIPHLAMSELKRKTGIDVVDVPYRGDNPVLLDLASGAIDAGAVVAGVLAGRDVRVIGIFAEARHPKMPDVPTFRELGFDVTQSSFGGIVAPAGTPAPILDALERACAKAAASEAYRAAAERGFQPALYYRGRAAFAARLEEDERTKLAILRELKLVP
jgi:tripartite-type tricarboxylate transporter receptor subunit TctC